MRLGSFDDATPFDDVMRLAIAQAVQANATDDVPIGAVVLNSAGTVIAAACNRREADNDPTAHAEILALRDAAAATGSWRLDGCTLVVTVEPCTMCAGAAVLARLDRLVFGAWSQEMGAVGTLWDVVRDRRINRRPEVVSGVLKQQCAALVQSFFSSHRDSG